MMKVDRVLLSALVVGVLGGGRDGYHRDCSPATTQNAGNEITSGTVSFNDNDNGADKVNV